MSSKIYSSSLKLTGRVEHVLRIPNAPDILLVVDDGKNSAADTNSNSAVHFARNVVLILLSGDWSLSCSFVQADDEIEITKFAMDIGNGPGRSSSSDWGEKERTSLSNAPWLVSFAQQATRTSLPKTTLCITPSTTTELIVLRKKRVIINFANVGNLELIDVTDKEQRVMEAEHLKHLPGLIPPVEGNTGLYLGRAAANPNNSATTSAWQVPTIQSEAPSPRTQASPKLRRQIASGNQTPSTPSQLALRASEDVAPIGVAGKNCYTAIDRYYDVVFGQSSHINPQVAFLERLIGGRTKILDAGSGSGLFAFTLRALGTDNITCLDKSLTMLRMLEEKNRFFEMVESELPDRQKKRRLRCIAGDVSSFSFTRIDAASGEELCEDFTTVLCLDVLSHLPDFDSVKRSLHCLSIHTAVGGQLIVSIPNAEVVVRQGHHQRHLHFEVDRTSGTMCAGATSAMPAGTVDVIEQTMIKAPHTFPSVDPTAVHPSRRGDDIADGIPRREIMLHGHAFHPQSATEEGLFVPFQEHITEILLSAGAFEVAATSVGFEVEGLYGSLSGKTFSTTDSEVRVYVLRRKENQFGVIE